MSLFSLGKNFSLLLNAKNSGSLYLPFELSSAGAFNKHKPNHGAGLAISHFRQLLVHFQKSFPSLWWWDQRQPHRGAEPWCLLHWPHLPLPIKRPFFALHHLVRAAEDAGDLILCGIFSRSSNRCSVLMNNTLCTKDLDFFPLRSQDAFSRYT